MKNLMVYISPQKKFDEEGKILVKVQIDNSLELGWAREDIVLMTNFPYEYNDIKALVLDDDTFCPFKPTVSKINAVLKLFDIRLIGDELYWLHDLDAFQQEKFTEEDVNLGNKDMGVCNYGRVPMWAAGTIFFKKSALVLFLAIQKLCYEWQVNEQKGLRYIAGSSFDDDEHRPILGRWVKTMNVTYNFNTTNMDSNYRQAEKPIRVIHFHLTPRFTPLFLTTQNRSGQILATERFRKILARYGITA